MFLVFPRSGAILGVWQDVKQWWRQGVGGLQSVVLYALPELDG